MSSTKQFIYGIHSIKSVLEKNANSITLIYKQKDQRNTRVEELLQLAKTAGIPIKTHSASELDDLTQHANHQGIVALSEPLRAYDEQDLFALVEQHPDCLLLILDGVTDPHNLGACLRTADAAGVHAVIAPKDRAAGLTPVARKVASGAAEVIPFIQVTNLARTMQKLRDNGVWIYGTDSEADKSLYEQEFKGKIALVMGAEGEGMRRLTREQCDFLISLAMTGTVASLNVSVATGVCLYEIMRQKKAVSCNTALS